MSATAFASASDTGRPVRVMIVDDALVVRGLVSRWLQQDGVEVVGTYRSAKQGLDEMDRQRPDVIVLDIEMPDMDGVTALPLFLAKRPEVHVIIASTLTRRNAELSMKCLSLGATDCLAKPDTSTPLVSAEDFRRELVGRVKALAGRPRSRFGARAAAAASPARPAPAAPAPAPVRARAEIPARPAAGAAAPVERPRRILHGNGPVELRKFSRMPAKVLCIGSSTGGPQALVTVITGLKPVLAKVPVLITQHMPPSFTTILAEHLARASGMPAHEPDHGEVIRPGVIYVAPGGKHMRVQGGATPSITLDEGPAINFCRPAVDPLFQSASAVWGANLAVAVLTGMGSDGARGAVTVADNGGSVLAQDEETSVVWGMPGATAHLGACAAVLPINDIAPQLVRLVQGVERQ